MKALQGGMPLAEADAVNLAMSEAELTTMVIQMMHLTGWTVHHSRPGMTSRIDKRGKPVWVTPVQGDPGLPDIIALKPPRLLVAELKSQKGRLTVVEKGWLGLWQLIPGAEVYVWRPSDFEAIVEILQRE